MGTNGETSAKVCDELISSDYQNKLLYQWIGTTGITTDITFHYIRHTYYALQLYNGTDITTIFKTLVHKDLKTKQIYAKILNEAKRQTTDKIKFTF